MKIGVMGVGNIGVTGRVDRVEGRADLNFNLALKHEIGRRLEPILLR